jgi:hypothetical protein
MSTTLTNASYINIFDEKLKSYNNIFFKTLQDYDLLNETTDIKNSAKVLNIASGTEAATYSTNQFNNFIRNIINFDIKNYSDLNPEPAYNDTNMEFVKKTSTRGSSATYTYNENVKNNIIDTLKILNVFVDILEAYKFCIDDNVDAIKTGYFDKIDIDRVEIVSTGTRFYASGAAVPDVNKYKNVGYVRNTKDSSGASPKNVLYLSIQSFYTGLTTAEYNYDNIFDKTNIAGNYNASTSGHNAITQSIFVADVSAVLPLQNTEIANKDYARHYYDSSKSSISVSNLTRAQRNKNVVSLLLKCLFNIDSTFRKQSVYALYYYYKFVQLYATLIINVSNVMYADVSDTGNNPKRIDIYNTGATYSITAIEVSTEGNGYHNNKPTALTNPLPLTIPLGGPAGGEPSTKAIANVNYDTNTGVIITTAPVTITNYGAGYVSAPTGIITTAVPNYRTANTNSGIIGSIAKNAADKLALSNAADAEYTRANNAVSSSTSPFSSNSQTDTSIKTSANSLIQTDITNINQIKLLDEITAQILKTKNAIVGNDAYSSEFTNPSSVGTIAKINALNTYIRLLIDRRVAELDKTTKNADKDTAAATLAGITSTADTPAAFKATIAPLAFASSTKNQADNINRLKEVIDDIENTIISLINEINSYSSNLNDGAIVILTSNVDAKIKKSATNNVVIMIAQTNASSSLYKNSYIYKMLYKYNENYDLKKEYVIYDKRNKKSYEILSININDTYNGKTYFAIEINAVFVPDPLKPEIKEFYNYNNTIFGAYSEPPNTLTANGDFLEIKRKDINDLKKNYANDKEAIDELNANISLNTNRVNNQKNLYETQYNKNVFLSRQILTYNILICTIIVVLIGINVFKIDKPLVKSISLACLGIIILLFIIYFMSNITYIETFAVDSANITKLKNTSGDITERNTNKVSALKTEIDKLNAQFIRYFETIMIKLPTSDSHDFYKEITSVINADIENKTYLDKILDFNKSQGNTNMDTLKYELENNKLYILTLLISSIIFIGLYNIYINYIDNEKYLSLMIFIAIIIFIVIGSYYIINSNRRVRTIHKNIYWGPQSSESF